MLDNLTGLRFYTALWVFMFHLSTEYVKELDFFPFNKGYLGVDVFFVLSGFILTYVYYRSFFLEKINLKKYYNFLLRRFAKIYPLHLLTFLLIMGMLYVGKFVFNQSSIRLQNETILHNVFLIHAWNTTSEISWNFPSWSISAEWFAYLFLFVLLAFLYRLSSKLYIFTIIFVLLFFLYKWSNLSDFSMNHYTFNSLERIIPEFLLGSLLGFVKLKFNINKLYSTLLFIFAVSVFMTSYLWISNIDKVSILIFGLLILSLSYKTYFDRLFSSERLLFLGNISFAFYLTQFASFIIFEQAIKFVSFNNFYLTVVVKITFVLLFNLLFAKICYSYYEEPIRKYIVQKFTKK